MRTFATDQFRGGSRIPRRRGRQPSRGEAPTYDFAKFCEKLHEIEKFLGRRGGARRVRPLLNPPHQFVKKSFVCTASKNHNLCKFRTRQQCIPVGCVQPTCWLTEVGGFMTPPSQNPLSGYPLHRTPFHYMPLLRTAPRKDGASPKDGNPLLSAGEMTGRMDRLKGHNFCNDNSAMC